MPLFPESQQHAQTEGGRGERRGERKKERGYEGILHPCYQQRVIKQL